MGNLIFIKKKLYVSFVVHQNISDEHWWRGCKSSQGLPMGCRQYQMVHHDHNVTVDECVCYGDFCNKNMTYGDIKHFLHNIFTLNIIHTIY